MSAAAAESPASDSPGAANAEIDGQQHQARAMGCRGNERPQRQLRRLDSGQKTRMTQIVQKVDAGRGDKEPRADADFVSPGDKRRHSGEGQKDARHRHEVPGAKRPERRNQVPSFLCPSTRRKPPAASPSQG